MPCQPGSGEVRYERFRELEHGFTLIELMLVVVIIGVLAVLAVPSFITYRNKSHVSAVASSLESVRAALASYATDSTDRLYPDSDAITDYNTLRAVTNADGAMLPTAGTFAVDHYTRFDSNGDNVHDSYSMRVIVSNVPNTVPGYEILMTPSSILKCQATGAPC